MLTPEEIQSREFLVSLRGYDRDEVHAFLDEVADAYASLLAQVRARDGDTPTAAAPAPAPTVEAEEPEAAPTAEPAARPSPFAAVGVDMQRILDAAQSTGEEIVAKAQAEADELLATARSDAEAEVGTLQGQASEIRERIAELESQRDRVAQALREARETVDLALLELDATSVAALPDEPDDPRSSVLAGAEGEDRAGESPDDGEDRDAGEDEHDADAEAAEADADEEE